MQQEGGQLRSKHSHRLQGNLNGLHGGGGKPLAEQNRGQKPFQNCCGQQTMVQETAWRADVCRAWGPESHFLNIGAQCLCHLSRNNEATKFMLINPNDTKMKG